VLVEERSHSSSGETCPLSPSSCSVASKPRQHNEPLPPILCISLEPNLPECVFSRAEGRAVPIKFVQSSGFSSSPHFAGGEQFGSCHAQSFDELSWDPATNACPSGLKEEGESLSSGHIPGLFVVMVCAQKITLFNQIPILAHKRLANRARPTPLHILLT
jgi:hypothetical protein